MELLKNGYMKKISFLLVLILQAIYFPLLAQTAVTPNYAFQPDEKITYSVFYNVIGIYVNAGSATFTTSTEKMESNDVYHVVGEDQPIQNMIGSLKYGTDMRVISINLICTCEIYPPYK
jgi:hypothetical protein